MSMFEIMTPANTVCVTMNDNLGHAPSEAVLTADDPRAIITVLNQYAHRHHIHCGSRIGYAVRPARIGEV